MSVVLWTFRQIHALVSLAALDTATILVQGLLAYICDVLHASVCPLVRWRRYGTVLGLDPSRRIDSGSGAWQVSLAFDDYYTFFEDAYGDLYYKFLSEKEWMRWSSPRSALLASRSPQQHCAHTIPKLIQHEFDVKNMMCATEPRPATHDLHSVSRGRVPGLTRVVAEKAIDVPHQLLWAGRV